MKNNILMVIGAILLTVTLSGCGNFVTQKGIDEAQKICENNGGISNIATVGDLVGEDMTLYCNNGGRFKIRYKKVSN